MSLKAVNNLPTVKNGKIIDFDWNDPWSVDVNLFENHPSSEKHLSGFVPFGDDIDNTDNDCFFNYSVW